MSCVTLLAADHPLPLYEAQTRRMRTVRSGRDIITVEEGGFSVQAHEYYRWAVDELGIAMKPCQYELDLRATEEDATLLRHYLGQYCLPGETVELWQLWVGTDPDGLSRFSGGLEDLDADTLAQLEARPLGQTCLSIRIS